MFNVLTEGCEATRGSKHSACVDLYASEDVTIGVGETKLVGLGICIDIEIFLEKDFDLNRGVITELYSLNNTSIDKANFLASHGENPSTLKREIERFLNSHYLQLMLRMLELLIWIIRMKSRCLFIIQQDCKKQNT